MKRVSGFCPMGMLLALAGVALAGEGTWAPSQLPEVEAAMRGQGLSLGAQDLWNPLQSAGLLGAVGRVGDCSASFVSPRGLVLTSFACVAPYLPEGKGSDDPFRSFLATTEQQEVPIPGLRVSVFRGYEDVTTVMAPIVKRPGSPEDRLAAVERKQKSLVAQCEKDAQRCVVREILGGARFYLLREIELRDVRLVWRPARGLACFGGDAEAESWPRHSADLVLLRAWKGVDGHPADPGPSNVPFLLDRPLRLAANPLKDAEPVVTAGFPAATHRRLVSKAVSRLVDFDLPQRLDLLRDLGARLAALEGTPGAAAARERVVRAAKADEATLRRLRRLDLAADRAAAEASFGEWVQSDPVRTAKLGDLLPRLGKVAADQEAVRERELVLGAAIEACTPLRAAILIERWVAERARPDLDRAPGFQARDQDELTRTVVALLSPRGRTVDEAFLSGFLARAAGLPADQRLAAVDQVMHATGASGEAAIVGAARILAAGTVVVSPDSALAALGLDHAALLATGDPLIALAQALRTDGSVHELARRRARGENLSAFARYSDALQVQTGGPLYAEPDGSLRVSWGKVQGYSPANGVFSLPFTGAEGLLEKTTGTPPFALPESLLGLLRAHDFGRWGDPARKDLPTGFVASLDVNAGSTGSPVLNASGELVGIVVGPSPEAVVNAWAFEPARSRALSADVRLMLWLLDRVDHAESLLAEMGVVSAGT